MNIKVIEQKIHALRQELDRHNYLYYIKAESIISDFEFDQKLKELEKFEKEYARFDDPMSP